MFSLSSILFNVVIYSVIFVLLFLFLTLFLTETGIFFIKLDINLWSIFITILCKVVYNLSIVERVSLCVIMSGDCWILVSNSVNSSNKLDIAGCVIVLFEIIFIILSMNGAILDRVIFVVRCSCTR